MIAVRRSPSGFRSVPAWGLPLALLLVGCGSNTQKTTAPASTDEAAAPAAPSLEYAVSQIPLETLVGQLEGNPNPAPPPAAQKLDPQAMNELLAAYYGVRKALAGDTTGGVTEAANRLRTATETLNAGLVSPDPAAKEVQIRLELIKVAAQELTMTQNIESVRASFGRLSTALLYVVSYHGQLPPAEQPYIYYCPMKQLAWLQDAKSMGNPYYGAKMLTCGDIVARADGSYRK
jgi:Cu(I)/Ag(I) efflux system membrane fusion protein